MVVGLLRKMQLSVGQITQKRVRYGWGLRLYGGGGVVMFLSDTKRKEGNEHSLLDSGSIMNPPLGLTSRSFNSVFFAVHQKFSTVKFFFFYKFTKI